MSDYIKREDAENIMLGSCDESALWKLRRLPRADVVEVRHGRWEKKDDPYGYFDKIPVCSECGCTTELRKQYPYCPNCGAKMDGERKEQR